MQPRLIQYHDQRTPDLNLKIARGLALNDLPHAVNYVSFILESAFRSCPQGVSYHGCEPASVHEEFEEYARKRKNKDRQKTHSRRFDMANSTKTVMKYYFKHQGQDLDPAYLAIPYAEIAGSLQVRGTRYNATPVITDQVFSIGVDNVFTRLARARVTFKKVTYRFYADNTLELASVLYSKIYNDRLPGVKERLVTCETSILLYTLCKKGFAETMRHFIGFVPEVGVGQDFIDKHDSKDWVICRSVYLDTGGRPKTCRMNGYIPSNLLLAIRRSEYSQMVKNIMGSFFYIADHFPDSVIQENLENIDMWRSRLGYSLFAMNEYYGRILERVNKHIDSLDNYIDTIVTDELKSLGYECHDIYTFFAIIYRNFNDWMLEATDRISSMYDKKLSVLYWVLLDITSSIFNLYFKLTAGDKEMSTTDVKKTISQHVNIGLFYMLASGEHAELSNETTSSSCAAFKLTSPIVPQADTARDNKKGGRRTSSKRTTSLHDPSKSCDVSIMEVGSHVFIQKKEGTGRSKINPFVMTDEKGRILRREELRSILDQAQALIRER